MPLTFEGREYPIVPSPLNFDALCDEALGNDAELKAAEADTRAAERTLTVNRQKWLPKLEIGYRRNTGEGSKEHGFLVGGSIPLFSNRRQVKMAQAQSIGARLQADETRLKAEAALHSGFNELQQLGRAMSVYDQPLMTQTLELLKESVKGGELSVTDYFVEATRFIATCKLSWNWSANIRKWLPRCLRTGYRNQHPTGKRKRKKILVKLCAYVSYFF